MPGKGGGGSTSAVNVNSGPVHVDSDSTVDVVGLDKISVTAKLEPVKIDSKQELVLPQPLKTDSKIDTSSDSKNSLSVDLKPVAVDLCLNSSTKLPHGEIDQPFSFHIGWTLFGVEMLGVKFGGESRVVMKELPKRPSVNWPAQQNAPASESVTRESGQPSSATEKQGLRVWVK